MTTTSGSKAELTTLSVVSPTVSGSVVRLRYTTTWVKESGVQFLGIWLEAADVGVASGETLKRTRKHIPKKRRFWSDLQAIHHVCGAPNPTSNSE